MQSRRSARLIAATCILALATVPTVWFVRRYHQQTLNHALIAAIKRSDAAAVESLLAAGADPNARDKPAPPESLLQRVKYLFGRRIPDLSPPALLVALNQRRENYVVEKPPNYSRIAKALLDRGADVHARSDQGLSPINELYCHYNYVDGSFAFTDLDDAETLKILLAAGADADDVGFDDQTPMARACENDGVECAQLLLEHGANSNQKSTRDGRTLLAQAQHNGYTDIVKLLKAHGAK